MTVASFLCSTAINEKKLVEIGKTNVNKKKVKSETNFWKINNMFRCFV